MVIRSKSKVTIVSEELSSIFSLRYYKRLFVEWIKHSNEVRGPSAVLQSLERGLTQVKVPYQLNSPIEMISHYIIVLSSVKALQQVILHKPLNAKILAGPNLVIKPSEARELLTSDKVDAVVVNSQWTYDYYRRELVEIVSKLIIWPAGVDIDFWKPKKGNNARGVLLYIKDDPGELLLEIEAYLARNNIKYQKIYYGSYSPAKYLSMLNTSKIAIFFSQSESQGLALLEAWATNTPTLVWDIGYATIYKGTEQEERIEASAAPYLTDYTGSRFSEYSDFIKQFNEWYERVSYNARDWVEHNMSDKICAQKLVDEFRKL